VSPIPEKYDLKFLLSYSEKIPVNRKIRPNHSYTRELRNGYNVWIKVGTDNNDIMKDYSDFPLANFIYQDLERSFSELATKYSTEKRKLSSKGFYVMELNRPHVHVTKKEVILESVELTEQVNTEIQRVIDFINEEYKTFTR